ncbi:MAG: hypothetical protein IJ113_05860, partial [Eggerthellaceae bacterium]|nr:hypothetical protein [Eggerthellaceae bacterium]
MAKSRYYLHIAKDIMSLKRTINGAALMSGIKRHFITVITSITLLLLAASLLCSIPAAYADPQVFAVTSEELFAQAESIMQEIDALQTTINEETRHYDEALSEHNTALEKANKAQARIEEEQEKINFYKGELSQLVTEMYKTKDSTSFLDVVLESADI